MRIDFLEKPIIIKEILKDSKDLLFEPCLIENNEKQIGQICEFLQSDNNLLIVNGFKGTGKSAMVDFVSTYFAENVLTLRYNCLETTILDDMLLNFFEAFRYYTNQGKIIPPRIKTENFTQKIDSYFHAIVKPVVIILNSYDVILKNNKPEIDNFIKHLLKLHNVKIIITSRTLIAESFEDIENISRVSTIAIAQPIFEKYLRVNGIKNIGPLSNELYKHSKGYFNLINLAVKIMKLRQLSLVDFLGSFAKSYMSFSEFISREALSLVDPVSAHLFRLLTVMRIPIHLNLLKSLHLFNPERVFFFVTNSILSVDGEFLYLQESFRDIIEHQIPENVMVKLHSACIDLYNTQLPLKPLERDLRLSRQTMRNEIEYHTLFIPKRPTLNLQDVRIIDVNPVVEAPIEVSAAPTVENAAVKEETKEEKINKISFIIDDEAVLDGIADSINGFITDKIQRNELEEQSVNVGLTQLLNLAKQEEVKYNYKNAILLYQKALLKNDDENFYRFLPVIYIKLAEAYKHLSQWYEALESYTQAQDFYFNVSDMTKVWEMKLEMASIYYIMYKHDNARFILNELYNNDKLPKELRIKVNLALAKLTDNLDEEYRYYKQSIDLLEAGTDKAVAAELYYKFAGTNDEMGNTKSAVIYYRKCIQLDSNPHRNKYLSMALANMAELYDEAGSSEHAVKYYNESIKIDKAMKNYSGLYYSAIHLAEIYSARDTEKSLDYLKQAYEYSKQLNEPLYIAGATIELGDFYILRKDYENAYKYYISAYNISKLSFNKENLNKIEARIEDVKSKVVESEFKRLQEKYDK